MKKAWSLCFVFCISLALGAQASAAGRLFHTNEPAGTIEELNPDTGAVINSFSTPIAIGDGCSALAFANNRLFFQNCGSDIYELNPSTGAVVNSFASPSPNIDGLGFSGTELYLQDYSGGAVTAVSPSGTRSYAGSSAGSISAKIVAPITGGIIYVLNPDTGAVVRTLTLSVPVVGGLTYAGGRNTLFSSDADTSTIYELNQSTGAVVNSFTAPAFDIFGLGYSFSRGTLFLGDTGSGLGTIFEVNPDTGAVIHTLPIVPNWGLAADENNIAAAAVPTMNEWGMILFTAFAGLACVYYLKKKRRTES